MPSSTILARALGQIATAPKPQVGGTTAALKAGWQQAERKERRRAAKEKKQKDLDEKYAVNIDPAKYYGPMQEEARVASQEHLDYMDQQRQKDPYNWTNSTEFQKKQFNYRNKMKALSMESDLAKGEVQWASKQDLTKVDLNHDLDKAFRGSPEKYRAYLKKRFGSERFMPGMYAKRRPLDYMAAFRKTTKAKTFISHIPEIDVEEGKHIKTKSGTYFNKEDAREHAREIANDPNSDIGITAAREFMQRFPDSEPEEIAQMVEDRLYDDIARRVPQHIVSKEKLKGGAGGGLNLNFGGSSTVGEFMLIRKEEGADPPDIVLKMWDRYQEDMTAQGVGESDMLSKEEFFSKAGVDTLKNKVVVRIVDLKGKIAPTQSFTTTEGKTIKGNAVAITKEKGIGGTPQLNIMHVEESAGAGMPSTYKLTTVPLEGKNSATNVGWLQGLHPDFPVENYLEKVFEVEEEEKKEVAEFTKDQYKQAGWSDAQIEAAVKAGKIKVK